MPTSVAGIAVRSGLVFVARRKAGGSVGGRWEFPGGKCEPGETPEEALVREYMEELGVTAVPGEFLGAAEFRKEDKVFALKAYMVKFEGEPRVFPEHDETRWVDRAALEQMDFAPSDRLLFPFLPKEIR